MRSTLVFVGAVLLVVFVASSVDARPDGSYGTDCASCHANGIPGQKPKDPPVTEPPATEPPVTEPPATEPPVVEPPVTEPPAVEPPAAEPPATVPPVIEQPAEQLQGVEMTTIWDYNIVEGQAELGYVFYAVVETDPTVNFVEIITPSGTVLQLSQEPVTQLDNVITRFTDEGDTFVWQCEARFNDIKQLAAYGKGKFTIGTGTVEAVTDTIINYDPAKASIKQSKEQKQPKEQKEKDKDKNKEKKEKKHKDDHGDE